jgi:peptidoglycan/LPS O-acetylase OafA/YrhL
VEKPVRSSTSAGETACATIASKGLALVGQAIWPAGAGQRPTPQRKRHLPALTGLRFVLAIWVIVHHLTGKGMMLEPWVQTLPAGLQSLVRGGYLAVGTFFVLSGFVLARSYGEKEWDRSSLFCYGVARIARVYPGYLLSLVIVSPFIYRSLLAGGSGSSRRVELLTNYGLVLQGWTGSLGVGWNTPAWSLSCKLFFYLCFPLLLMVFARRTWPRIIVAALVSIVLPLMLAQLHVPWWWKPFYHTADFLVGIVASHLFDVLHEVNFHRIGIWLYGVAGSVGALMVAFPQYLRGSSLDLNSSLRPVNVAILIGLAIGGGLPARLLSSRLLKYLGQASYSMYILHVPLLWWYSRYMWRHSPAPSPAAAAAIYIVGVIVVSALAFELVEEPANRMIRQWAHGKS